MKNFKILSITTLLLTMLVSCVNSDNYGTPDLSGECADVTANKNVLDIINTSTSSSVKYVDTTPENDDIIEAYVTSSDEGGTFYKSISLVSLDKTKGFSIPVDDYNLYTKYRPGQKVYVNMTNRYIVKENGSTVIGSLYNNETPDNLNDDKVGRISGAEYQSVFTTSCKSISEEDLVNKISVADAKNDSYLNKLIEFENVQFVDENVGKTYFNSTNQIGGATNNLIVDQNGKTIILRVSEFANFASKTVPNKSGKIRGVLTKFSSDYQFIVRTEHDMKLTNDRFEVDLNPPIVGNNIQYLGALSENFESYSVNNTNFPKYINDPYFGPRLWQLKQFPTNTGNKYIEMSSFNGSSNPGVPCNTFFMVPVDFTAANTMTFKEEMRFYREESPTGKKPLTVYYIKSEDYVAGSIVDRTKLIDITSSFNITYPAIGQAENSFNSAGTYNIPTTLTGNGYFVFEYYGTATLTTTVQIDDIIIN